jgi:uncharacterized repeat protein (TIGR01451 family)
MKVCFLRTSQLLKIATLVAVTIGMVVGFWVLDHLLVQAAPPAQGPIGVLEINHRCNEAPLNDTYDSADLLKARQAQTHTLDSGGGEGGGEPGDWGTHDKDWFEFTVLAGQGFTLSTTIPPTVLTMTNILTQTEISLFTSTTTALSDSPAYSSTQAGTNELGWIASSSPATQTFWARVRNPSAASQDPSNNFCDVAYNIQLRLVGTLAHSGTLKNAEAGPGRTLTYTLILSNAGEMLNPVVVTDTLPDGVYLTGLTYPSSVTIDYLTTTTSLSWTGWISDYSSVQLTINATATQGITDVQNTAWITVTDVFSVTSNNPEFGPEGVFLPIILKNFS